MSLGTWFRDYLYIPLGGNRRSIPRQILNILIVWAATGIWHGANWTFLAWGLYFAIFLILEKFFFKNLLQKLPSFITHIYCLLITTISWVIFNSPSLSSAILFIKRMFTFGGISDRFLYLISQNSLCIILCIISSIPFSKYIAKKVKLLKSNTLKTLLKTYPVGILAGILFVISILYLINSTFNAFIYFRF